MEHFMRCPCCGHKIKLLVSEDVGSGVFFDMREQATASELSKLGLELGLVEGGENENGE